MELTNPQIKDICLYDGDSEIVEVPYESCVFIYEKATKFYFGEELGEMWIPFSQTADVDPERKCLMLTEFIAVEKGLV